MPAPEEPVVNIMVKGFLPKVYLFREKYGISVLNLKIKLSEELKKSDENVPPEHLTVVEKEYVLDDSKMILQDAVLFMIVKLRRCGCHNI